MPGSTFQTNPIDLDKLLDDCHRGSLQLPDFQRSWVWDEERIKSLIASISRAFPIGALMSLDTRGPVVETARANNYGGLTAPRHQAESVHVIEFLAVQQSCFACAGYHNAMGRAYWIAAPTIPFMRHKQNADV
jgi:hypothetical protein